MASNKDFNRDRLLVANKKEGFDINEAMNKLHPDGDEYAIIRKEIHRIEEALNIEPSAEFAKYWEDAENAKSVVKARLQKHKGA